MKTMTKCFDCDKQLRLDDSRAGLCLDCLWIRYNRQRKKLNQIDSLIKSMDKNMRIILELRDAEHS